MTTVETPDVFAGDDPAVPEEAGGQGSKAVPEAEIEAEAVKDEGSTYIVLRAYSENSDADLVPLPSSAYLEGEVWQNVGSYVANNGNAAIRKAIATHWSDGDGNPTATADGHYATTPARSWNPTPVEVKQPPASIRIGS